MLALNDAELAALGELGLVISDQKSFGTFMDGYVALYGADLPLFVSADSILHAVHRSYDDILKTLELDRLIPELGALLEEMRSASPAALADFDARIREDVDLFLSVAQSLLTGERVQPAAGGNAPQLASIVDAAMAASGLLELELFGAKRTIDFSQFKPRGHYTDSVELERYFRAMIWLGRAADLRIIETQPDATQIFRRGQLYIALALRKAMGERSLQRWQAIEQVLQGFVGESDNMTAPQVDRLLADLGTTLDEAPRSLDAMSDAVIAQAIRSGGYGAQRIPTQLIVNYTNKTLPPSAVFLLFGQRFTVDSHVFSNLVYDRVGQGQIRRMMPSTLDLVFAAFGNDQAVSLLADELERYPYAPDLHAMRVLIDAHDDSYWQSSLYTHWLGALRTLSPGKALDPSRTAGLPEIASTEAWGRRLINTQLASWAELRHDTILYVKQSETGVPACEFPDAYVEPYPEFFEAIAQLAQRGQEVVPAGASPGIVTYFQRLEEIAGILKGMAEHQRSGQPFSAEQMAFINRAVVSKPFGCAQAEPDGWYRDLFYAADATKLFEPDPTIADVHTQPADENGNIVGRVLHVGTGRARLMVITASTCEGPRAYAGLASSYFETITESFDRYDDERWAKELNHEIPADVEFMKDLVIR